jgi:hypothetical protein
MTLAKDLLEQADHLARREKRKPKQASLRRATPRPVARFSTLSIIERQALEKK